MALILMALLLIVRGSQSFPKNRPQVSLTYKSQKLSHVRSTSESACESKYSPQFFVLLNNLQSGSNIGSICRNALAFNASEVILIGRKGIPQMRQTDRGARGRLTFSHFFSIDEAAVYLKTNHSCQIFGVEIMESAIPVTALPFARSSAFVFGNEGGGLSARQREICDGFIYIPQFASGMASINVACASAIVFYNFATWAGYSETTRKGEKFQ